MFNKKEIKKKQKQKLLAQGDRVEHLVEIFLLSDRLEEKAIKALEDGKDLVGKDILQLSGELDLSHSELDDAEDRLTELTSKPKLDIKVFDDYE